MDNQYLELMDTRFLAAYTISCILVLTAIAMTLKNKLWITEIPQANTQSTEKQSPSKNKNNSTKDKHRKT